MEIQSGLHKFSPLAMEDDMFLLVVHNYAQSIGQKVMQGVWWTRMSMTDELPVFPLVQNQKYEKVAEDISESLTVAGISHMIDITGTSIGKRYAISDGLGVPFAITVDTISSVTIRERDSKDQIRVKVHKVASVMTALTYGHRTWEHIHKRKMGRYLVKLLS
ncbi:hypothetical protein Ddye_029568 [Dipteronia dyeriana]|uniref:Anticodon-binding domain-containing protein n=1 Tax=Dipteronia dyeriana TaxID=168575 RepID=A0AAD9TFF5_9ROSI|nr:hypothetical protein Ddye_029568 [Dipteronia dyeriana]